MLKKRTAPDSPVAPASGGVHGRVRSAPRRSLKVLDFDFDNCAIDVAVGGSHTHRGRIQTHTFEGPNQTQRLMIRHGPERARSLQPT